MTEKKNSFEETTDRLETLVEELETGDLALETSLKKFAEGMKLIKECREILDAAEQKVKVLMQKKDGETLEDFQEKDHEGLFP